jgi:hypothetical protein
MGARRTVLAFCLLFCGGCKIYELDDVDKTAYLLIEPGQAKNVFAIQVWSGVAFLPAPGRVHVVLVDRIPDGSRRSVLARAAEETPASRRLTEGERSADLFDLVGARAPSNDVSATRWLVDNDPPVVAINSRRPPVAAAQRDLVWHARLDTGHLVTQDGFRLVRESDLDEQVDQVMVFARPGAAEAPARVVRRLTFDQPVTLRKLYLDTAWLGE